jgi:hypothetical protein
VCDEAGKACVECLADSDCLDDNSCTADTCVNHACVHTWREVCDDFDEDGIDNDDDACPNTPVGEEVDAAGCACSQLDQDGDGVNNCDDQCPDTPRDKSVDEAGCPVTLPVVEEEGELEAANPGIDFGDLEAGTGVLLVAPEPTVPTQASDEHCACAWSVEGTGAFDPNPGCVTTYTPALGDTLVTVSVNCTIDGETTGDDFDQAVEVAGRSDDGEVIDDDETEEPADEPTPGDEDVIDEPVPGPEVEPGAEAPEEPDTDSARARSSRPTGAGTCGLLGMFNLAGLLAGMALLRRSPRR